MKDLNATLNKAYKWSTFAEISSKVISPLTNMILARLLSPTAFGIVAIAYMVTSFAEIFTDSGFQKYLIQNEFDNESEKNNAINISFFVNFVLSIVLFFFIFLFRNTLASRLGNEEIGLVIVFAAIEIPLSSFFSIQTAILKRDFQYKKLFYARLIVAIVPFIVTIPLALLNLSFWAIIIGHLSGKIVLTIYLLKNTSWKPKLSLDFRNSRYMFKFIIVSTLAAIAVWFSAWLDSFFISQNYDGYSLGLYRQSILMVSAIFGIITSSINGVLFSALSRLQKDSIKFDIQFFSALEITAYIIFPLGTMLYVFRDISVLVIFGAGWSEASYIFGVWALTSILRIILVSTFSEYYRAKGYPILNFVIQIIDILVILMVSLFYIGNNLNTYTQLRSIMRFVVILPSILLAVFFFRIKFIKIVRAIIKPFVFSCVIFSLSSFLLHFKNNLVSTFLWIFLSGLIYLALILTFSRNEFRKFILYIGSKP